MNIKEIREQNEGCSNPYQILIVVLCDKIDQLEKGTKSLERLNHNQKVTVRKARAEAKEYRNQARGLEYWRSEGVKWANLAYAFRRECDNLQARFDVINSALEIQDEVERLEFQEAKNG